MKYKFLVKDDKNMRVDKYLSNHTDFSRSFLKKLIDNNKVFVNNNTIKSSYKLEKGDLIVFDYEEEKINLKPKEMNLDLLYEDEDISIINKEKGVLVHPARIGDNDTLVNGLLYRYDNLGNEDSIRPGIVHRLDRDTTGLLVIARDNYSYRNLVDQFKKGRVIRKYLAICHGELRKNYVIDKPIGRDVRDRRKMAINHRNGKRAISVVNPLKVYDGYTLVEVELKTGRTHQIRVHLSDLGFPVVGDMIYGHENKYGIKTQMLHAYFLEFKHPRKKEMMEFKTDIPKYFQSLLRRFTHEESLR